MSVTNLNILLVGASGAMGRELFLASERLGTAKIIGGIVAANDPFLNQTIPGIELPLTSTWVDAYKSANIVIDFSSKEGAKLALTIATEHKIPTLICSTGLDSSCDEYFSKASSIVPVLRTSNTSVGVAVMHELAKLATRALGQSFDIEIAEIHHSRKKDAPSGTAIALGQTIATALEKDFGTIKNLGRAGDDTARKKGELGIQAIRGGSVAGEHTIYFLGEDERLEVKHTVNSRRIFANGALRCATWLVGVKKNGLYSMSDVVR